MDNKAMVEGMKKLKSAIEDFIDNVELDEDEKVFERKKKKKAGKDSEKESEKDEGKEDD